MAITSSAAGYANGGAGAYARVGVESRAMCANPHRLILMLFDGLLMSLRKARLYMENGNMSAKGMAVSRALDIINQGLLAALDRERGGQVAENLAQLYEYSARALLKANAENNPAGLDEVHALLSGIAEAWSEIGATHNGENLAG